MKKKTFQKYTILQTIIQTNGIVDISYPEFHSQIIREFGRWTNFTEQPYQPYQYGLVYSILVHTVYSFSLNGLTSN